MRAHVGDRIVVKGQVLGTHERDGEVIEVHGAGGEPPYVVRWFDEDTVTLVFPGPDALISSASHGSAER